MSAVYRMLTSHVLTYYMLLCVLPLSLLACSGAGDDDDDPVPTSPTPSGTDQDQDGFTVEEGDCDDTNQTVYPGADELCDGLDNNCNGEQDGPSSVDAETYYLDSDADAYGNGESSLVACEAPAGYTPVGGDCNDRDATINPGEAEICDGIDNNCNGEKDGATSADAITYYYDGDKDGFGNPTQSLNGCTAPAGYVANGEDCNDASALISPNATEVCDGLDNDCDTLVDDGSATGASTWYIDKDNDGYGDSAVSVKACAAPNGYVGNNTDCNDRNGNINPGATELSNGVDDDCDGKIDEGGPNVDDDGDGYSENQGDCDDNNPARSPVGKEGPTCDGVDQDCDLVPDDGLLCKDDDGDGYTELTGDCDDLNSAVNPGALDFICDGIDTNCDGTDANGCSDIDKDGYSVDQGDCNDNDGSIYPGAPESFDGTDEDCDGYTDEGSFPINALVISEFLPNPTGTDSFGEFFELYNFSGLSINLLGWSFYDNFRSNGLPVPVMITQQLVVPPGDYVILASCGDSALNGLPTPDVVYGGVNCTQVDFALGNQPTTTAPEMIVLLEPLGKVISSVSWSITYSEGFSAQLRPAYYGTTDSATGSGPAWCAQKPTTPGQVASCP